MDLVRRFRVMGIGRLADGAGLCRRHCAPGATRVLENMSQAFAGGRAIRIDQLPVANADMHDDLLLLRTWSLRQSQPCLCSLTCRSDLPLTGSTQFPMVAPIPVRTGRMAMAKRKLRPASAATDQVKLMQTV